MTPMSEEDLSLARLAMEAAPALDAPLGAVLSGGRGTAHAWPGPGPEPRKWVASDGTLVYRSYEDYCDD